MAGAGGARDLSWVAGAHGYKSSQRSGRGAKSSQWEVFAWGNPIKGFPQSGGAPLAYSRRRVAAAYSRSLLSWRAQIFLHALEIFLKNLDFCCYVSYNTIVATKGGGSYQRTEKNGASNEQPQIDDVPCTTRRRKYKET